MPYPQEFIDSVTVSIPSSWYKPEYFTSLETIPSRSLKALQEEPDYAWATQNKKGVMFDLLKQLMGYQHPDVVDLCENEQTGEIEKIIKKGRTYRPRPQHYTFFAFTAFALLHGDINCLNWRKRFSGNLTGQDIVHAMNKYGVFGLSEDLKSANSKKLASERFAALYSRMYNNDLRFHWKSAEPAQLQTDIRLSPITFCPHCKTVHVLWDMDKGVYEPEDVGYNQVKQKYIQQISEKKFERNSVEDQDLYSARDGYLLSVDRLADDPVPSA
jgi:glutaredoxin